MLDRRSFIRSAAALGLAHAAPAAFAGAAGLDRAHAAMPGSDSRLLGWKTPESDRMDTSVLDLEGVLPDRLKGVFRRNGPAGHDRHGLRYHHWFDGDGMIQEFRFGDGAVSHRGRMLRTPKLRREDAAGRRLYPAFGTHVADGAPVRGPDDMNPANISVLDHHGELMALWEGGSPSVIDRDSLAWQEFKTWDDSVRGLPFTAHPKVEADGTLWAFGYAMWPDPLLLLYHVNASGSLVKAAAVRVEPLGMVHDFVVTRRSIVIVIPPFVHGASAGGTFLDSHVWRPELGSRALVVSKDDFDDRRWVQLPAGFGFHHGNGWEEADGTIRFDHCVAADPGLVDDALRDVMQGRLKPAAPSRYTTFVLHPDGRADVREEEAIAEFPQVAPARVGRRNRFVYTLGGDRRPEWVPGSLEKRDLETGAVDRFAYGRDVFPEEHVFVPFPDGKVEDDGWLVGTFLAHARGQSGISVFDARRVSDGPVALAWLPYPLPLGFHGQFSGA